MSHSIKNNETEKQPQEKPHLQLKRAEWREPPSRVESHHAGGRHTAFSLMLNRSLEGHIGVGSTMKTVVPRCKAEWESEVEGTPFLTQEVGVNCVGSLSNGASNQGTDCAKQQLQPGIWRHDFSGDSNVFEVCGGLTVLVPGDYCSIPSENDWLAWHGCHWAEHTSREWVSLCTKMCVLSICIQTHPMLIHLPVSFLGWGYS